MYMHNVCASESKLVRTYECTCIHTYIHTYKHRENNNALMKLT